METKPIYPDEQLLTPKQIALMAGMSIPTIYNWLKISTPENGVRKGTRTTYKALDVRTWLEKKTNPETKRTIHKVRTARRLAESIIQLRDTDTERYLAILTLLREGLNPNA
jgi:predicted DNA-binding transcriptional regulator AlpA